MLNEILTNAGPVQIGSIITHRASTVEGELEVLYFDETDPEFPIIAITQNPSCGFSLYEIEDMATCSEHFRMWAKRNVPNNYFVVFFSEDDVETVVSDQSETKSLETLLRVLYKEYEQI